MNSNDYGYQPGKNIFLAMYDENYLTYDGNSPIISNGAEIDVATYPEGGNPASLVIRGNTRVHYNDIAPIGTSDFTLDFYRAGGSGYGGITSAGRHSPDGIIFNSSIWLGNGNQVDTIWSNITYSSNWEHYALVRNGKNLYYFRGGKLIRTMAFGIHYLANTSLVFNSCYTDDVTYLGKTNVNFKAVRLCKYARWTEEFIPPTPKLVNKLYLYLNNNQVYGSQNGILEKIKDNWSEVDNANKKESFLSTNYETASIADLQTLGKFKVLTYSETEDKPEITVTAAPKDQLILPKGFISVEKFDGIDKTTLTETVSGGGVCKIIVTTDLKTYQTYDFETQAWKNVDHTDLGTVKSFGIDATQFATISRSAWNLILKGKVGLGIAYLMGIEATADQCAVDKLAAQVDMKGTWVK